VALTQRHCELERRSAARSLDDDPRSRLPETNQLGVLPRARREALSRNVQRLEQVRLADAVASDDQDDSRRQCEVERRV